MNKMTKTNIINFLNWNDKNANIDDSYSSHELLALFIYELNYNILDCYNWIDLLEYNEVQLLEDMDYETKECFDVLDCGSLCDVTQFDFILNYVK